MSDFGMIAAKTVSVRGESVARANSNDHFSRLGLEQLYNMLNVYPKAQGVIAQGARSAAGIVAGVVERVADRVGATPKNTAVAKNAPPQSKPVEVTTAPSAARPTQGGQPPTRGGFTPVG